MLGNAFETYRYARLALIGRLLPYSPVLLNFTPKMERRKDMM